MKIVALILFLSSLLLADNLSESLDRLTKELLSGVTLKENVKVAVLPLTDSSGEKNIGLSIAEYLVVSLQKQSSLSLVDRVEFEKVINELTLSNSEMADTSFALQAGKMRVANYILSGSVIKSMGKYRVVVKLISTETTELVSSAATSLPVGDLDSFTKELYADKNWIVSSTFRSVLIPGWGQFHCAQPIRGTIFATAGAASVGFLIFSLVDKNNKLNEYHEINDDHNNNSNADFEAKYGVGKNSTYDARKNAAYDEYESSFDRAKTAGILMGIVWGANIIDAIIAGKQREKMFKLYFSTDFESVTTGFALNF